MPCGTTTPGARCWAARSGWPGQAGELDQLPVTLGALGTAVAWSGDFAAADALVAEADAVCAATGSRAAPFTAMMLAALRGSEADALPLVGATLADAAAAGQGIAVTYAQWTSAVLFNGLSRYEEALTAARQASDDTPGNYVAMWALPELAEAAARSGQPDEAAGAVARLAELTGAGRTDFGLGVEARCRALVSPPEAAEPCYREAIDRLGRTRLRPELARAHLLYGEWLRRENRRADARTQLRTAHDLLSAIGAAAFAERARRELMATGETVHRRAHGRGQRAYRAGSLDRPARGGRLHQPRDRRSAVPVRPHGRMAPAQGVQQARHQLPP